MFSSGRPSGSSHAAGDAGIGRCGVEEVGEDAVGDLDRKARPADAMDEKVGKEKAGVHGERQRSRAESEMPSPRNRKSPASGCSTPSCRKVVLPATFARRTAAAASPIL